MLHIAICDDQPDQIRSIRQSSERYFQEKQDTVSYETFDNAFSFVDTINQGAIFDIVLLDVCMPASLARRWHKNCASSAAARRSSS